MHGTYLSWKVICCSSEIQIYPAIMYLLSLAASGGLVSPPGGEGGVENSGKEAGGPMANDRTPGRPASGFRAAVVGLWEKAPGLLWELRLLGGNGRSPAAAEGSLENNVKTFQVSPRPCQHKRSQAQGGNVHERTACWPVSHGLEGSP